MNEYTIINNMYYQGTVNKSDMAHIQLRDFYVEIIREDVEKTFFNIQYYYICRIVFKDLLGRIVREIVLNENQARILLDNMSTFIYDNYTELVCLSDITSTNIAETYGFKLSATEENGDFCVLFQVICYNSVLGTSFPVISTVMSLDELDKLTDIMYFIFLIDLVSERKGIYKV